MPHNRKAPSLPALPGVYLFKDAQGAVLYVGKAKSLATRIRSYFSTSDNNKLADLLREHTTIDHIVTHSEDDALLLEEYLIKRYQPPYNVLLKTGHPFLYLVITNDDLPNLLIVRKKELSGRYFGPFTDKKAVRRTHDYLIKQFQLYRCNMKLPHGCLKYHLGICAGTCTDTFNADAYRLRMKLAEQALAGESEKFQETLDQALADATTGLRFEEARQLHDYLKSIDKIFSTIQRAFSPNTYHHAIAHQEAAAHLPHAHDTFPEAQAALQALLGIRETISTIDCFDVSHMQGRYHVGSCIRFTNGIPDRAKFRRFALKTLQQQDDYAALREIITRRYRTPHDLPDLILIDGGKGQLSTSRAVMPEARIVSLAKREERLFTEQHPEGVLLDVGTPLGKLLIAMRDYAHHFAISYHTLLKTKGLHDH